MIAPRAVKRLLENYGYLDVVSENRQHIFVSREDVFYTVYNASPRKLIFETPDMMELLRFLSGFDLRPYTGEVN